MSTNVSSTTWATKPHYDILDGLRGVAALVVLCYHLFEAIAFAPLNSTTPEQQLYHGFIAVDFFFILSGFVMGYAYDERWQHMSVGNFFRRRLIRLHPMVVMGVLVGVACFFIQGSTKWDGTAVSLPLILLCTLLSLFLLPTPTALEVRGNTEAFPLNGPHWSLFLEYIGSILYALLLRRMPTRVLKVWVAVCAVLLLAFSLFMGENTIGYGWSSQPINLFGGLLRLSFGYPAGLLLARLYRHRMPSMLSRPVFLISTLVLLVLFLVPGLGSLSCFYQVLCVCVAFPLIVWYAARGSLTGTWLRVARFLGRISYPLYAVHYPLVYLYIHWIQTQNPEGMAVWVAPLVVLVANVLLATVCMLFYDEPLRRWLLSSRTIRCS